MQEGPLRDAQTRRGKQARAVGKSIFPLAHSCSPLCVCASVRLAVAAPVHYALFSLSSLGARTPGHQFHLPAMCMIAGTSTMMSAALVIVVAVAESPSIVA